MVLLKDLMTRTAQNGAVTWIGLRPARRADVTTADSVELTEAGLAGDHRSKPGKRALSLIQAEHLEVIRALSGCTDAGFADLRRNLAISCVNLLALRGRWLRIGAAEVLITGICAPCSRMETALGHGGYAAMRGHGGMTAEVITPGKIALGDAVYPVAEMQ